MEDGLGRFEGDDHFRHSTSTAYVIYTTLVFSGGLMILMLCMASGAGELLEGEVSEALSSMENANVVRRVVP